MKLISHRGNICGRQIELENTEDYILKAIKSGYDVEVDIQKIEGESAFIGHDTISGSLSLNFLWSSNVWAHAKNIVVLQQLLDNNIHCFWHEEDKYTLTSRGYIWAYPAPTFPEGVIAVLPEKYNIGHLVNVAGICSDFIEHYRMVK